MQTQALPRRDGYADLPWESAEGQQRRWQVGSAPGVVPGAGPPHTQRGSPLRGLPLAVAEVMEGSSPCQLLWHPGPVRPHPPTRAPHPCPQGTVLRTRRKGGRKGSPAALPSPQLFSPPPPAPEPLETPRSGGAGSTGGPGRAAPGGQGSATSRTPRALTPAGGRLHARAPSGDRPQAPGAWAFGPHG